MVLPWFLYRDSSRLSRTYASQGPAAKILVAETFKHYNYFWQLRTHFKNEDVPLFALTPKGHHCNHASIFSTSLSPRQGIV